MTSIAFPAPHPAPRARRPVPRHPACPLITLAARLAASLVRSALAIAVLAAVLAWTSGR